jgi:hypothetical protein
MRKGKNISKDQPIALTKCAHRVIMPLFIPHEEGYYKEAFQVFEMCLRSVIKTSKSPIKVSVIYNGGSKNVQSRLMKFFEEQLINELIIEGEVIGKINSILKVLRTVEERLVTITDADVLFLNNWEQEVIKVFEAFPKAGMVSPVPVFRTHLRHTLNIWVRYLFSKKLRFLPVKNPEAMTRFANSIGWPWLDEKFKDIIATLRGRNNTFAVVGNAHFVGTYKSEVFKNLPKVNSRFVLGGDSEYLYTDLPIVKSGGYRLATLDNFAYHIGNTTEDWINKEYELLSEETKEFNDFSHLTKLKGGRLNYYVSEKLFKKLFKISFFKRLIFKMKGLTDLQFKNFTGK